MSHLHKFLIIALISFSQSFKNDNEPWSGKWFPFNPNDKPVEDNSNQKNMSMKWFPHAPMNENINFENDRIMGIPNKQCDDGETNLHVDFEPNSHDLNSYICLEKTYSHEDIEPIEIEYDVPSVYTPVHKCMNESINYPERVPTLGYHRPLWAAYGSYRYLPPQRWLHNIEHGSIVMLYHPCANQQFVEGLRKIVKSCLYRHIITPHRNLTTERPLALAAWGKSLEFSVFDRQLVVDFIKQNAKKAPEKTFKNGQYSKLLIEEAKIISDENDSELCREMSVM